MELGQLYLDPGLRIDAQAELREHRQGGREPAVEAHRRALEIHPALGVDFEARDAHEQLERSVEHVEIDAHLLGAHVGDAEPQRIAGVDERVRELRLELGARDHQCHEIGHILAARRGVAVDRSAVIEEAPPQRQERRVRQRARDALFHLQVASGKIRRCPQHVAPHLGLLGDPIARADEDVIDAEGGGHRRGEAAELVHFDGLSKHPHATVAEVSDAAPDDDRVASVGAELGTACWLFQHQKRRAGVHDHAA